MQADQSANEGLVKELQQRIAELQGRADGLFNELTGVKQANLDLISKLDAQLAETLQVQLMLDQTQRDMKMQYLAAVKSFSNFAELRSPQLAAHGLRVAELARLIAKELHVSDSALQDIYVAGLLHDIGKIGLNDDTLFKPVVELKGAARVALMKHPMRAQAALHGMNDMGAVIEMIRHHHERYDGQGFPDGLAGEHIPLGARILAVAEDYDELQQGWLAAKEFDELQAQTFIQGATGKRYDPLVTSVLPTALDKLRAAEKPHEKIQHGEDLLEGMMLTRDFSGPDGFLWLSKDHVVSRHFIDRVREAERLHNTQLKIYTKRTGTPKRAEPPASAVQPPQQTGHVAL